MSNERHKRIQTLFLEAVEVPVDQREQWLTKQCGEDLQLIAELRALMAEDQLTNDPLERGLKEVILEYGAAEDTESCSDLKDPQSTHQINRTNDSASADQQLRPTSKESKTEILRPFGDYEILERIAEGGMGVVYKARQTKLDRVVALKMIRAGQLAGKVEVQRFHTEAEAAAQFDHPNIVSIYEVGEQEGQHFFSMAFVEGKGLDARLKEGPLPPREAAELIRTIAEAIQYAHEKGIVHRDLKPANVLIDADDNPRITDFGLAKNIAAESGMTATGQIMGTPSYMPPEQASGKSEEIGPLADVYSLGAMLYALLTGRPPFQAANVMETLQQVCEQEPVSPRVLNAAVDRDLETICLKCIEKSPQRRYMSADHLADDLQRFLERRPISARPISYAGRFVRWYSRNRVLASATVMVFVSLVMGLVGTLTQMQRAREGEANAMSERDKKALALERETAALSREKAERQLKESALITAQKERDKYLKEVTTHMQTLQKQTRAITDSALLKEPRFADLKRNLLKNARENFTDFVKRHRDDPKMAEDVAYALFGIALIERGTTGSVERAMVSYKELIKLLDSGVFSPMNDQLLLIKGESENILGVHDMQVKKYADALNRFGKAQDIFSDLARRQPKNLSYQTALAQSDLNRGILHGEQQEWEESLRAYGEAVRRLRQLHNVSEHDVVITSLLAKALNSMSTIYFDRTQLVDAEKLVREAIAIHRMLAESNPGVLIYRRSLGSATNNLANLLRARGKPQEAAKKWKDALVHFQQVLAADGTSVKSQSDVAFVCLNLAILYEQLGQRQHVEEIVRQGMPVLRRLVRENPTDPNHALNLAYMMTIPASQAVTSKDWPAAKQHYSAAIAQLTRYGERFPKTIRYRTILAQTYTNASISPQVFSLDENLANLRKALMLLAANVVGSQPSQDVKMTRWRVIYQSARLNEQKGNFLTAVRYFDQTAAMMPNTARAGAHSRAALCLARAGQHVKADQRATQLLNNQESARLSFVDRFRLAQLYGFCAAAARSESDVDDMTMAKVSNGYAEKAVAQLDQCVSGGFFRGVDLTDILMGYSLFETLGDEPAFRRFAHKVKVHLPAIAIKPSM